MDLSLLRTCLAVYRTGSLTRAARMLGVSQPAVTGQIRALEVTLGQQLFVRASKGAVPTDAAHELVRDTAQALDNLEGAICRRLRPTRLDDRTVRLAGPAEFITHRVLPAAAELVAGGLRIRVSLGLTDDLVAAMLDGAHDLVITTRQPHHPAIVSKPLMDEEFALVGGGAWPQRLSPEDIDKRGPEAVEEAPVISYADSLPLVRRYWLTVFGQNPTCSPRMTVPDLRGVLAAVKAGAGISVLPTYLCTGEVDRGEITVLYDPVLPPLNTLFLASRAGDTVSVGVATLHAHLLASARRWR